MKIFNFKNFILMFAFITATSLNADFNIPLGPAVAGFASGVIGAAVGIGAGAFIKDPIFFIPVLGSPYLGARMCKITSKKEHVTLKAFDIVGVALTIGTCTYFNESCHGEPNALKNAAVIALMIAFAKSTLGFVIASYFEKSADASH